MTDIVDRLRNHTFQAWPLRTEAADEIERIRAENQSLQKRVDLWEPREGTAILGASHD